jgi:hypothetical protein
LGDVEVNQIRDYCKNIYNKLKKHYNKCCNSTGVNYIDSIALEIAPLPKEVSTIMKEPVNKETVETKEVGIQQNS